MNPARSPITAAKHRHRLYDVARRTGIWVPATTGTLTVRCPMPAHGHYDHTPSLRLHLDDDTWYCYACSHHTGDVIDWAQQTENVGWRQAIQILGSGRSLTNAWEHPGLAPTAGLEVEVGISERADPERTPAERVQQALDTAWHHATTGAAHARAVAYLTRRGINLPLLEDHIGRIEAGHTPTTGPGLVQRLTADGYTPDELVDAGIAHRHGGGTLTDFYRDRVLIPIRDPAGKVAGLVGRNVGDPRWPKYKNPPRTAVYDKSVQLYQPLPPPTHPAGRVIIVEGTIDALQVAVVSLTTRAANRFCPVAQSGLALSAAQIRQVLAMSGRRPVIALDGDAAGRKATNCLAKAFTEVGVAPLIAALPEGEDPASWLQVHGRSRLAALGAAPEPFDMGGASVVHSA